MKPKVFHTFFRYDFSLVRNTVRVEGFTVVKCENKHPSHTWTLGGSYILPTHLVERSTAIKQIIVFKRKGEKRVRRFVRKFMRLDLDLEGNVLNKPIKGEIIEGEIDPKIERLNKLISKFTPEQLAQLIENLN